MLKEMLWTWKLLMLELEEGKIISLSAWLFILGAILSFNTTHWFSPHASFFTRLAGANHELIVSFSASIGLHDSP